MGAYRRGWDGKSQMDAPEPGRSSLAELVQALIESRSVSPALRVGVTGHRVLEARTRRWASQQLYDLFSFLAGLPPSAAPRRALSSLAIGTDQLFAEAAHHHGIPFEVVIPFASFIEDFATGTERDSYERLLSAAASIAQLPWAERSDEAYLAGGVWVVDHCDLLIAIWNGEKAAGAGGTGEVVGYSRDTGKPCIHMHATALRIEMLS